MFLRRNRRTVNGECSEYWTLVKTVRTAQGPRQESVATLGKEPGLESRSRQGWEQVAELLEGRSPAVQGQLGEAWSAAPQTQWAPVDWRGVRGERVREFTERAERRAWAEQAQGAYLLRTNCPEKDPAKLWRWYVPLSQAEEAFRIRKSDQSLRPVFHPKTQRVEAHILVCFLTLALWRTLEMWRRGKGLGNCSRQRLKEVATVRSLDVVLPVKETERQETRALRLRVVARPDRMVAELLVRLGLELPSVPKGVQM